MIDLTAAIKMAKERNEKYNAVQEYADAYVFSVDDGVERDGGGDSPIVIEKGTGRFLRWAEYFMDGKRAISEIGEMKRLDG